MRIVRACGTRTIPLGRQGENQATQILFPIVQEWKTLYGSGTFQLLHQRKGDKDPYAVSISTDEQNVVWIVSATDLAVVGNGKCELTYIVNDTVAKSQIYATVAQSSMTDAGEAPEPWKSWVDEVLQAGSQARESAEAAAESAEEIEDLTVSAHGLPAGSAPTVIKTGGDGEPYNLDFGLPAGSGGATWEAVQDKPFETLGETLKVVNGVLNIVIPPEYGRVSYDGFALSVI